MSADALLSFPVCWVSPLHLQLPTYQTAGAAGMDLYAVISEPLELAAHERQSIPTGIAVAMPDGYEAQVRPRSGLAWRHGITVLNSPGTIDADYRGEIKVILINHSSESYTIQPYSRIAQLVFAPIIKAQLQLVPSLPNTSRADKGFGSTGGIG